MHADLAEDLPPLLLTEGGPGDVLLRRLHLKSRGHLAGRAAIVAAVVTWLPLLVLTLLEGRAIAGATIPFFYDIAAQVRFLVAVPILLLAEIPIGGRLRDVAARFVRTGLVRAEDRPRFMQIIASTVRLRDSRLAGSIVLAAAYATTYAVLMTPLQGRSTWAAPRSGEGLTPAGWWYAFVSIPVFQFLLYRWIYRMAVWARFLGSVSRLDLQLTPTHPDGAGGLGFLGKGCIPFGLLLLALSAVVASSIATRVLFEGANFENFEVAYGALFALGLSIFAGPLLVFVPKLLEVKRRGQAEYGALATRYTQLFHRKWVEAAGGDDEALLGSGDIQSLADLGNSFELVRKMRPLPIGLADFVAMALPGVLPVIPLAATVIPMSDVAKGLLHLLAG